MLKHLNLQETKPERVVVLGANGFVGNQIACSLAAASIPVLPLSKTDLDLLQEGAAQVLLQHLKPTDVLVIVSAIAPCKNAEMLLKNIRMMNEVTQALEKTLPSQVIYISSDAVYPDAASIINEETVASPNSLHGMMHLAREMMLSSVLNNKAPLAILRSSLLYGLKDPHNGYGPNRFRRLALENKTISLFGEGEEKRDHIAIEDVGRLVKLLILNRSQGILNIATGQSHSFREVAEFITSKYDTTSKIEGALRQGSGPILHRHFDITACHKAFPEFHYTSFEQGMISMLKQAIDQIKASEKKGQEIHA